MKEKIILAPWTSYKIGGPARYFAQPENEVELAEMLRWARCRALPVFCLGKGTNLVISDRGFAGLVLQFDKMAQLKIEGQVLRAEAGALLDDAVRLTVGASLAGMEELVGIPGTVGGGVYINAGAFGQEIGDYLTEVRTMTLDGRINVYRHNQCGFGYRKSNFIGKKEILLSASFKLCWGNPVALRQTMETIWARRQSRQPLEYPNAGSMFKRPVGTYAGKLIEEADLKGFRLGGAQISPKHANFVINVGDCKAQDIQDLSLEVIERVRAQTGIKMEREQIFVGEFEAWPR